MKIKIIIAFFACLVSYTSEAQDWRRVLLRFNKAELQKSFTEKIENEITGINTTDFKDFSMDLVYKFTNESKFIKRLSLEYKRTKHFLKEEEFPIDDAFDFTGRINDITAKFGLERQFTVSKRLSALVYSDINLNFGKYKGEETGGLAGVENLIKYSNYETGLRVGLGLEYRIWWKIILSFETSVLGYKYWNSEYDETSLTVNVNGKGEGNEVLFNPFTFGVGWKLNSKKNKNKKSKSNKNKKSKKRS